MTKSAMPAIANRIVEIRKKRRSLESSSRWPGWPAILKKKRRNPAPAKSKSQTGTPASSVGTERMYLKNVTSEKQKCKRVGTLCSQIRASKSPNKNRIVTKVQHGGITLRNAIARRAIGRGVNPHEYRSSRVSKIPGHGGGRARAERLTRTEHWLEKCSLQEALEGWFLRRACCEFNAIR